ncbi:hypothetical protein WJX84_007630 [Apatococcus fuscideae]|uniref:Serine-threonine/tyrosine-protein kinase catalytic domain-containing protein n=1 Tax=Apatococcus fuscideae TaxID=2026836 RepID=A0AAW1T6Q6_9CHLO
MGSMNNPLALDPEFLSLGHVLGSGGGCAEVRTGTLRRSPEDDKGREVAVKMLLIEYSEVASFQKEVQNLAAAAQACHRVCKLYGTCVKGKYSCIVMKLYNTTLAQQMKTSTSGRLLLD